MKTLQVRSLILLLTIFLPLPMHTTYLAARPTDKDPEKQKTWLQRSKQWAKENPKKSIALGVVGAATVIFLAIKAGIYGTMHRGKDLGMEQDIVGTKPFDEKQPLIFSHGYGGNKRQLYGYTNYKKDRPAAIFSDDDYFFSTFNYPEVRKEIDPASQKVRTEYYTNINEVNFAQEKDIGAFTEALSHFHSTLTGEKKVLCFGVSRGAAALITSAGSKPELFNEKAAALILESPFASVNEVIAGKTEFLLIPETSRMKTVRFVAFTGYKKKGIKPIDVVDKIPTSLPILIVHSKKDKLIPISHSRQLYIKLKQTGRDNVYLAELDSGKHAKVLWGNNGAQYRSIVHAFNKKYGLSYKPEYADSVDLSKYQPKVSDVKDRGVDLSKF